MDDTSSTGNVYQLTRNTATATTDPAGAGFGASAFSGQIFGGAVMAGSVTWTALGSALPTWLTDNARVDVVSAAPSATPGPSASAPRSDPMANTAAATPSGLKISTVTPRNFRFWYEIQDNLPGGTTLYSFPSGLAAANGAGPSFPNPSGWKQSQLDFSSSCDGDILFDSNDVYVNTVGTKELDLTSNTFHATPENNVPGTTPPGISTSES